MITLDAHTRARPDHSRGYIPRQLMLVASAGATATAQDYGGEIRACGSYRVSRRRIPIISPHRKQTIEGKRRAVDTRSEEVDRGRLGPRGAAGRACSRLRHDGDGMAEGGQINRCVGRSLRVALSPHSPPHR